MRRERRNWAEAKGFEFMKADPYLVDEWTRGVASTGAAPKDIVAGNVYGHEMLLMDIDGVNVMAMRTGAASDMVVDFRRFDRDDAKASEDLLLAMAIEGFDVYSSDSAVTERMVDERVHVALQQMPEAVTALWMETEWVLAQTTKQARSAEWDAMLPPLALLADAARVLPAFLCHPRGAPRGIGPSPRDSRPAHRRGRRRRAGAANSSAPSSNGRKNRCRCRLGPILKPAARSSTAPSAATK